MEVEVNYKDKFFKTNLPQGSQDLSYSKLDEEIRRRFHIKAEDKIDMTYTRKDDKKGLIENDQELQNALIDGKLNPLILDVALVTMHGSSSRPHFLVDGKLAEQLAEFLQEQEGKRKSLALSKVNSQEWDTLGRASGLTVIWKEFKYKPKLMSDLPRYGWDDRLERAQADRYIPHLNKIRKARKYMMIDAANKFPTLLSGAFGGYTIRGTTDVAIIHRDALTLCPNLSLRCIFELKNGNVHHGRHQMFVSLVMANILSPQYRPFALLTDLIDDWNLCWIDRSTIYLSKCQSRAVAVGSVEDLLQEDQDSDASAELPFLATMGHGEGDSVISQISKRQKYVPPGTENVEDLVGLIPDDEILNARVEAGVRHLQQMLQMPQFGEEGRGFPEGWYV